MKYAQHPICSILMYALLCAYLIEKPMNAILTDYSIATLGLYRGVL